MGEDLGDDGGVEDGGEDGQGAAAVGTPFNVYIKHEQLGPAHARRRRGMECLTVARWVVNHVSRRAWDDLGTELGIRGEHAMEADEMEPRTGHERGEALHEFQGFHNDMGSAISVRCLREPLNK